MSDESDMTREEFIAQYVARARSVGLKVEANEDGCIYLETEWAGELLEEERLVAVKCDCEGHDYGWHMEIAEE